MSEFIKLIPNNDDVNLKHLKLKSIPSKAKYNQVGVSIDFGPQYMNLEVITIDTEFLTFDGKVALGAEIVKRWNEHNKNLIDIKNLKDDISLKGDMIKNLKAHIKTITDLNNQITKYKESEKKAAAINDLLINNQNEIIQDFITPGPLAEGYQPTRNLDTSNPPGDE